MSLSTKPAKPNDLEVAGRHYGENIRRFRTEASLTLKQLSQRSGVSIATISKIENGKISGGFTTVYKIARGLGVLVTEIVKPKSDQEMALVVKPKDAAEIHPTGIYDYYPLAYRLDGRLNPYVMVVHTKSVPDLRDWSIHNGEEVIHVVSGIIELHIEGQAPQRLAEGDSACFDSGLRHAFVCRSRRPAKLFSVSTRESSSRDDGLMVLD